MEYLEAFQNLPRNLPSLCSRRLVVFHICAEISVRDELHRQKYFAPVFVPAKEFDENVFVLGFG